MQQFTVPQFIDVENQIIGPITTRQFLIFLAAAVIIGGSYKLFDFSLFLTITIIVSLISISFAFIKINGRPFHLFVLNLVQTLRRPKIRVWSNRLILNQSEENIPVPPKPAEQAPAKFYHTSRLAELALVVDTKGRYRGEK